MISADGGLPRRLTQEPSVDVMGTWSRDGRWIYFQSNRTGSEQVWKIPAEGGEAVQLTRGGGGYPLEAWDGRFVYYSKRSGEVRRVPTGGGEESLVMPGPVRAARIAITQNGLYFLTVQGSSRYGEVRYEIKVLDLESEEMTEVYQGEGLEPWSFLAVSPDDEWVLFSARSLSLSELMLVENFR